MLDRRSAQRTGTNRRRGTDHRGRRHPALRLQRAAGNRAVGSIVRTPPTAGATPGPAPVQRHASWEHALLGDAKPGDLARAAVEPAHARHVMSQQWRQNRFFASDATKDPRRAFPDVRWIKLRGSGLWVSYGELNALADYLPDPGSIDSLERSVVLPVVQRMRHGISGAQHRLLQEKFAGQADSGWYEHTPVGGEKALDQATAGLGANRYFGLLTRNACHFAPFSWNRWAIHHNQAREEARTAHRVAHTATPIDDIDTTDNEHLRQAWLNNGYGDHFLQDSFAAGHLINKTLVMQWFVDYLNDLASRWWDLLGPIVWWGFDNTQPWYGMPDDEVMETMGSAQQPGISGQHLYGRPPTGRTAREDQVLGSSATDPQSAQERETRGQRVAGSGVRGVGGRTREQGYQAYLRFLNSSFLNLAAGMTHDYFNERGLSVSNENGDTFTVGGDDTLISESSELGARRAGEAAEMSRTAITEILRDGSTGITVESIWALVPTSIWHHGAEGWQQMSIPDWHTEVLKDICWEKIFPDAVDSFNSKTARALSPELSDSGVELDGVTHSVPVPDLSELGDFPPPTPGDTRSV
ncbi:MAG: hypothetical protein AAFZ07_08725 [Actinomycetota bacterium]